MYRTPPRGPTGPAGSDADQPHVDQGTQPRSHGAQASPAGSEASLFKDPAVMGVVKTPKSKPGGPSRSRAGVPDASTGAIPKSRSPTFTDPSNQANDSAPGHDPNQVGPVPSYIIETYNHGPVELLGKSEAVHAKYLNSFKTSVGKAEKRFATELRQGNVSIAELREFCDHLRRHYEKFEILAASAQYQGYVNLVVKGNVERYLKRLNKVYEECVDLLREINRVDDDQNLLDSSDDGGGPGDVTIPDQTNLRGQGGPPDQGAVGGGGQNQILTPRQVGLQVSSIVAGVLTGQPRGAQPLPQQTVVGPQVVPNQGNRAPVAQPQPVVQPQRAGVQTRASLQVQGAPPGPQVQQPGTGPNGPPPQVNPRPVTPVAQQLPPQPVQQQAVQQVVNQPINPPGAQAPDPVNLNQVQQDPNGIGNVLNHPQYVARPAVNQGANPGQGQPNVAVQPPRNPQQVPAAQRPVVPQPRGNIAQGAPIPPPAINYQVPIQFDPDDFLQFTEQRVTDLVQRHLSQALGGTPGTANPLANNSSRGNLGQTFRRDVHQSTPKKSSLSANKSSRRSRRSNWSSSSSPSS